LRDVSLTHFSFRGTKHDGSTRLAHAINSLPGKGAQSFFFLQGEHVKILQKSEPLATAYFFCREKGALFQPRPLVHTFARTASGCRCLFRQSPFVRTISFGRFFFSCPALLLPRHEDICRPGLKTRRLNRSQLGRHQQTGVGLSAGDCPGQCSPCRTTQRRRPFPQ
jgi:hypothetical protein